MARLDRMPSVRSATRILLFAALCLLARAADNQQAAPKGESAELATLRAKAVRGNSIAQYNLGLAYAQSSASPSAADRIEAFVWLALAAEGGSTGKVLGNVLSTMSDTDLQEGRRRIAALRAAYPQLRLAAPSAGKSTSPGKAPPIAAAPPQDESTPPPQEIVTPPISAAPMGRPTSPVVTTAAVPAGETKQLQEQLALAIQESRQRAAELASVRSELSARANTDRTASESLARERTSHAETRAALTELQSRSGIFDETKRQLEAARALANQTRAELSRAHEQLAVSQTSANERVVQLTADLAAARNSSEESVRTATAERDALAAEKSRLAAELTARSSASAEQVAALEKAKQERDTLRELQSRVKELETEKAALASQTTGASTSREEAARAASAQAAGEVKLAAALRSYELMSKERDELGRRVAELTGQVSTTTAALRSAEARTRTILPVVTLPENARTSPAPVNIVPSIPAATASAPSSQAIDLRQPRRPTAAKILPTVTPPAPATPPAVAPQRVHTIAAGETLGGISRRYYGTANRWPEILAANRDTVRDERSLIAGRTLKIP